MKKISYILIAIGLVVFVIVTNKACKPSQGGSFQNNSFEQEVRSVEVVDGNQKITYKDHSSMSFSGLNTDNPAMKKYDGKNFTEIIFPGDSIYKEKGSLILTVKPVVGKTFDLDVN